MITIFRNFDVSSTFGKDGLGAPFFPVENKNRDLRNEFSINYLTNYYVLSAF